MGIIMDGHRRFVGRAWVGVEEGNDVGASMAYEVLDWRLELGITHVTLWDYSSEGASRAPEEVAHRHQVFAEQARALDAAAGDLAPAREVEAEHQERRELGERGRDGEHTTAAR